jgi:hypothetical protein
MMLLADWADTDRLTANRMAKKINGLFSIISECIDVRDTWKTLPAIQLLP